MKINSLLSFAFCLGVANPVFAAYKYDLRCQDKKMVWLNTGEKPPPSSECQTFLKHGFAKCYDTRKASSSPQTMTISTPNDQYYESKESDKYDRKAIQEIIQAAARSGNDPYLALSLVLVENPPLIDSPHDDGYAKHYGQIPVDKIGIADIFNCDAQIESFNSAKAMRTYINKGELREFNIDPRAPQRMVCLTLGAKTGSAPNFGIITKPNDKYCCAKVRLNINAKPGGDPVASKRMRTYFSNEYIKRRFNSGLRRAESQDTPAEKMAMIAQAYNGYGTFGATEKMANKCLTGVDMGRTPVYGAGVSETMLNSVMNNSEIKKMVDDATRAAGAKPSSYLCEAYGNGDHKISGYAFTGLLKGYVGSRSNCPRHSYALKGSQARNEHAILHRSVNTGGGSSGKKVKTSN